MSFPTEIPKVYQPREIEERWYPYWERNQFFAPGTQTNPNAPIYSIVIPPPNVTGYLHMGHALNHTLQDVLARWRRMSGDRVLWLPGTDHAGIATQMVVERQLMKEGIRREDLGRGKFLERVWQWKAESGGTIQRQMRILGESVDWSRERFTLDEGLSAAVREVFVRLYDEGLIYRGEYLVNWSPGLQTAISDLEVEMEPVKGKLYHIAYPVRSLESDVRSRELEVRSPRSEAWSLKPEARAELMEAYVRANEGDRRSGSISTVSGEFVVVVTTRPETMQGDTAVALNPKDDRYRHLIGRRAILPLVGRELPFVQDDQVEIGFGTGLVKVTPAHDPNDFAIGRRHKLEFVTVIGKDASMTDAVPEKYRGLDRFEARDAVVADLEAAGLLLRVEDYTHNVGHCQRSGVVVEPLVSTQWFVRMKPLAQAAIKAVQEGRTSFVPENWTKVYFDWLERIEDWCISRQLWWGHRIPAWHSPEGEMVVARSGEDARARFVASGGDATVPLRQDEDVLDTWFSSALWPFSTLGWPDPDAPDLRTYYPTTVLVTGPDIIFFWVARMMMMGLEFVGDVPFKKVYINSIVVDPEGRKMSKTKGNVVDPLTVFEQYGTDAVRFTLAAGASPGTNISLQPAKMEANRNFANKIWNAARFALMNCGHASWKESAFDADDLPLFDRWIILRLHEAVRAVNKALEEFRFHEAAGSLYHFFWDEFCDWYIECAKPVVTSKDDSAPTQAARERLIFVLETSLRLLHPFMPFITEEIWQRLPHPPEDGSLPASISLAPFPSPDYLKRFQDRADSGDAVWLQANADMAWVIDLITALRNVRSLLELPPSARVGLELHVPEKDMEDLLKQNIGLIERLAGVSSTAWVGHPDNFGIGARGSVGQIQFNLITEGVDVEKVKQRVNRLLQKEKDEYEQLGRRYNNPDFIAKAGEEVKSQTWARLSLLEGAIETKKRVLESLG